MIVNIRIAEPGEFKIAFNLLKEAAEWLQKKGTSYWQNWHHPEPAHIGWIMGGFEHKQFYYVEINSEIIGMFRLQDADELFWGQRNDKAGYIHSFTIRRKNEFKGLGLTVLDWIYEKLRKEKKDFIRLDCGKNITGLCSYYEKYGFKKVGEVNVGGEILNLYEMAL